jgi:putative tricarboxylic transport membrane protein
LMEEKFRLALNMSRGNFWTFFENWKSALCLVLAALVIVVAALPSIRKGRDQVFTE